jgi:predicted Rossmann fold flavoprotein
MSANVDVLIIGAGAAGMMCAIEAARRGRSVQLLDHSKKLAEKIRISGGGRCNFTNLYAKPENYLSGNPHFCRSALARYTPRHFITWLEQHGIGYHEKKLGQLFCDEGSAAIITMLKNECDDAGVRWLMPCEVQKIERIPPLTSQTEKEPRISGDTHTSTERFSCITSHGTFRAQSLVIASGGLSIPKIGATPFGYQVAQQFGILVTKLKPGLVPLSFHPDDWAPYVDLAGISVDAAVSFEKQVFRENLLFTHRGLSGPAILQISSYWQPGQPLHINLLPDHDIQELFAQHRNSRMLLSNFFAQYLPKRFVETWCAQLAENNLSSNEPINQYSGREIAALASKLHDWRITPSGTLGYAKAEVTCGGIDTHALSSKTMEANEVNGLYFIGEVVDVTGQLGGYNFQWAWSSGYAAGQYC